nr:hypothetical protein [Lactobacillus apis]
MKKWEEIGKSEYPKQPEIDQLRESSKLQKENIEVKEGHLTLEMPPHSCAFVTIPGFFN